LVGAYRALGRHRQARVLARKANRLVIQWGGALDESVLAAFDADRPACTAPDEPADDMTSKLSDAQLRVARLAALGCTNLEIAQKLYITVSTVEQHLSQVYRRLRVRRPDLPLLPADLPSKRLPDILTAAARER
jgi:DNA-binding NarL/FixJ family response regulator